MTMVFEKKKTKDKPQVKTPIYLFGSDPANEKLLAARRKMKDIKQNAEEAIAAIDNIIFRFEQMERSDKPARALFINSTDNLRGWRDGLEVVRDDAAAAIKGIDGQMNKNKQKFLKNQKGASARNAEDAADN